MSCCQDNRYALPCDCREDAHEAAIAAFETLPESQVGRYAQTVIDLIREKNGGVSFVEINRALEADGMEVRGDYAIDLGLNVMAWGNVTQMYVEVIKRVVESNEVHMQPTQTLVYIVDGEVMRLPIAQNPPAAGYRKPHWLPVAWSVGPHPSKAKASTGNRATRRRKRS